MKVEVNCCEGYDNGNCLRGRCPIYEKVKAKVEAKWPYEGTGFGNLYGSPGHGLFLEEVREEVRRIKAAEAVRSSVEKNPASKK